LFFICPFGASDAESGFAVWRGDMSSIFLSARLRKRRRRQPGGNRCSRQTMNRRRHSINA
jgi:hypothetical protein